MELTNIQEKRFKRLKEFTARTVLAMTEKERGAWEKLENGERAAIAAATFYLLENQSDLQRADALKRMQYELAVKL